MSIKNFFKKLNSTTTAFLFCCFFSSCITRTNNELSADSAAESWPDMPQTKELGIDPDEEIKQTITFVEVSQNVLLFGDSGLTGGSGDFLHAEYSKKVGKSNAFLFAVCGSRADNWKPFKDVTKVVTQGCGKKIIEGAAAARTSGDIPRAKQLAEKYLPRLVVMSLGTNDFWLAEKEIEQNFAALAAVFETTSEQCFVVGPANVLRADVAAALPKVYRALEKSLKGKRCQLIDMRPIASSKGSPDQLHLVGAEVKKWRNEILKRTLSALE